VAAEVAGGGSVGSKRAVIVLSGVGKSNGVGVENPGNVHAESVKARLHIKEVYINNFFISGTPP
jgi:hypothetical protein